MIKHNQSCSAKLTHYLEEYKEGKFRCSICLEEWKDR